MQKIKQAAEKARRSSKVRSVEITPPAKAWPGSAKTSSPAIKPNSWASRRVSKASPCRPSPATSREMSGNPRKPGEERSQQAKSGGPGNLSTGGATSRSKPGESIHEPWRLVSKVSREIRPLLRATRNPEKGQDKSQSKDQGRPGQETSPASPATNRRAKPGDQKDRSSPDRTRAGPKAGDQVNPARPVTNRASRETSKT